MLHRRPIRRAAHYNTHTHEAARLPRRRTRVNISDSPFGILAERYEKLTRPVPLMPPSLSPIKKTMSIAKVIEVIAEGKSVEDALENAVAEASKSVHGIKSIYAEGIQASVKDGVIKHYRINAKITFVLD